MSFHKRYVTFADIMRTVWFIRPQDAEGYYPTILSMLEGNQQPLSFFDDDDESATKKAKDAASTNGLMKINSNIVGYRVSAYGEDAPPENAPRNSVAIFDFKDVITKYDQYCGDSGMLTKRDLVQRAGRNPNIIAMVFDVDSPGGDGHAAASVTQAAKEFGKPVISHVEGMGASAAMWLIANTQEIFMNGKGSEVGSIGSYVELWNFTEYYKQKGIEISRIYAPQSTLKNKDFEDALKGDDKAMKAALKQHVDFFIEDVKKGRSNISSNGDIFKGAMFFTDSAIQEGLADTAGTLEDAITRAYNLATGTNSVGFNSNKNSKNTNMSLFSKYPDAITALVKSETVTAEQVAAVNAQLKADGINAIVAMSVSDVEANKATTAEIAGSNSAQAKQIAELQAEKTKLEGEITSLKAEVKKLGEGAAAAHSAAEGKETSHDDGSAKPADYSKEKHNVDAKQSADALAGLK